MTLKLKFDGPSAVKQDYVEYFNDFNIYLSTDFTITNTGSPTNAVNTGKAGGILELTNGASDDNATFHDYKIENFVFDSTKKLYFGARWKLSDVTQADMIIGLQITDTTPLAVSDGIWFQTDDGDALLDFHVAKSSTQTDATGIATLVNDTYLVTEFYYEPSLGKIQMYLDGVSAGAAVITNAPSHTLCLSFGVQNGEAVAKVMSIDWIRIVAER